MYRIKYNEAYIFDPFEEAEVVTDAKLTNNINAAAYLDFTMSPKHPLYNTVAERDGVVTLYSDNEKLFEGTIDSISTDFYGYKDISCVSALDYLGDTLVRPYSTVSGEADLVAPSTIEGIFQWYIDQHNKHVLDNRKTFQVGVNQGGALTSVESLYLKSDSLSTTSSEINNNIIDAYGGYLVLRYEGSQRVLDLYADIHEMNPQVIDFGVNITDFTKSLETKDQYTAIRPKGGTPESTDSNKNPKPITIASIPDGITSNSDIAKEGDVIYSISGVQRYGYRETVFEDTNILSQEDLLKVSVTKLNTLVSPTITIDVRAVDLALYLPQYTHLLTGQAVRVRSKPHGVDEYLMVSSIELDLQNPENTEYVLGTSYDTLTGQQSAYLKKLNASINSSVDAVAALDQVTKDNAIEIGKVTDLANDANNKAEEAGTKADNAQQSANEAGTKADNAQQSANDAAIKAENAQNTADQANSKADQLTEKVDSATQAAQEAAKKAQDAADASDQLRKDVSSSIEDVKLNVNAVEQRVDAAEDKAAQLEKTITADEVKIEANTTAIGGLQTTVSAVKKDAESALTMSTQVKQDLNEVSSKATSAYENAEEALAKTSTLSQRADSIEANLSTNYQTKADSDALYATQAALKATSESITTTVSKTYATKDAVEAIQNIADNAIETWQGTEDPVATGKPASDWNTPELRKQHNGDVYYNTENGHTFRWFYTESSDTGEWTLIKDSDITKAMQEAAAADKKAEDAQKDVDKLKVDIPATYASKSELKQTSESITATVTEVATVADNALAKATTVEQTANGLKTTVSEQASTISGHTESIAALQQTSTSLKSEIEQTSTTVDGVLNRQTSLEQNLDGFKTTVSKTYATIESLDQIQSSLTERIENGGFETGDMTGWSIEGDASAYLIADDSITASGHDSGKCRALLRDGAKIYQDVDNLISGNVIHVGCYIRSNSSTEQAYLNIQFGSQSEIQVGVSNTGSWAYLEGYYRVPDGGNNSIARVTCGGQGDITRVDDVTLTDVTDYYNSLMNVQTQIQQNADNITQVITTISDTASDINDRLDTTNANVDRVAGDLADDISARQVYMRFSDVSGNPTLELGASTNQNKLVLSNEKMSFMSGTTEVAYVSNDRLYINNVTVVNALQIGDFLWKTRSDGHLVLTKI